MLLTEIFSNSISLRVLEKFDKSDKSDKSFASLLKPLTYWLSKGVSEQRFSDIGPTNSLAVCNLGTT